MQKGDKPNLIRLNKHFQLVGIFYNQPKLSFLPSVIEEINIYPVIWPHPAQIDTLTHQSELTFDNFLKDLLKHSKREMLLRILLYSKRAKKEEN